MTDKQIADLANQLIAYKQSRGELRMQRGFSAVSHCGTARLESVSVYQNGKFCRTEYRFDTPHRSAADLTKDTAAPKYRAALINSGIMGATK